MAFLDELRRRFRQTPGYAGGTLEDQIARQTQEGIDRFGYGGGGVALNQSPQGQVLTPQNQQAITRPRTVIQPTQQPSFTGALKRRFQAPTETPTESPNVPFGSTGEAFGSARPRRVEPRDYISDEAAALRELQVKPRGRRDKIMDVVDAVNAGLGNKPRILGTRRERALAEAQSRLGTELTLGQKQAAIQQNAMVPFQLPDGTWTQIPAKSAATVGSRQQGQQANLSLRRQQMEAHNQRWDTMGKHEAARDAQALYNSGAADDDDDLRDEIAKRMGLPEGTRLPPHTQGQIRVDESGNYVLINPRSGVATSAVRPESARPVGSMQPVLEAGRNRRAAAAQAGATQRAGMRGTSTGRPDRTTARKAAELVGQIETARKAMAQAEDALARNPNDRDAKETLQSAQRQGEGWATELNALDAGYEAGTGQKSSAGGYAYPYYKKIGTQGGSDLEQPIYGKPANRGGRTIEGAVKAFTKRLGRAPTADETARMKAALGQ